MGRGDRLIPRGTARRHCLAGGQLADLGRSLRFSGGFQVQSGLEQMLDPGGKWQRGPRGGSGRGGQGTLGTAAAASDRPCSGDRASFSAAVCWTADASCPRRQRHRPLRHRLRHRQLEIGAWSLNLPPFTIHHSLFVIRHSSFVILAALPPPAPIPLPPGPVHRPRRRGSTFWRMLQTERRYQRVPSRPPRKCCQTASPIRL